MEMVVVWIWIRTKGCYLLNSSHVHIVQCTLACGLESIWFELKKAKQTPTYTVSILTIW